MRITSLIAIALVILGLVGLAYGGISFTREKKVVDLGPLQVTREKHETLPVPPIAGGICLVAGVVLLVVGAKDRA